MNSTKTIKNIIWDWNGTLLDDVSMAVGAMNSLLQKRGLPLLDTNRYRDIFTFPVESYYHRLGFDFAEETFEKLAYEFVAEITSEKYQPVLHGGAGAVLDSIGQMGIQQFILSASKEAGLINDISKLAIDGYFVRIAGLNNHYAESKVQRGRELLLELGLNPRELLLIGDTAHDKEVADELGCGCLLICGGHQSYGRIQACNTDIIESISEVVDFIRGFSKRQLHKSRKGTRLRHDFAR